LQLAIAEYQSGGEIYYYDGKSIFIKASYSREIV